tara:strand:+ start:29654 stop:30496 length:843 start_codon:yes stop_codon:yes gene_type:complete
MGSLKDKYKEHRCLRLYIQTSVSICVLVWLSGLVIGPTLLLQGHCDLYPTVNQTQVFRADECIEVLDKACRGTVVVTGYFDAICDGKNYTGITHIVCFTQACIRSEGVVKIVTEKNYYSINPEWLWWIVPGIMVYLWWAPVIFIAIIITKNLIHRFFVREDEILEEETINALQYVTVNEEPPNDTHSDKIPRLRPLTPPLGDKPMMNKPMNKLSKHQSYHPKRKSITFIDHKPLLDNEILEMRLDKPYVRKDYTTTEDERQSDNNLFNGVFSDSMSDGNF